MDSVVVCTKQIEQNSSSVKLQRASLKSKGQPTPSESDKETNCSMTHWSESESKSDFA